jgi:hypothetical protein
MVLPERGEQPPNLPAALKDQDSWSRTVTITYQRLVSDFESGCLRVASEGHGGELVSNTPGRGPANLFGWMMELAAGNGFVLSLNAFNNAGSIIERLLNAAD